MGRIGRCRRPERVLVVADVNIGDAMLIQPAVGTLSALLPDATVDFAVNATVGPLVAPDSRVGTTFAILRGDADAPVATADRLRSKLHHTDYDLVFNLCPFVGDREAASFGRVAVSPLPLAIGILDALTEGRPASIPVQVSALAHRVVGAIPGVEVPVDAPFEPARVFLDPGARRRAMAWLRERGFDPARPPVFVNPDASNDSTFLGLDVLAEVVARLTADPAVSGVVLGRGFTYRGIEDHIQAVLEGDSGRSVHPVPERFPLEDFCALVDCCRVVVSGDTGPMHLAAAEKRPRIGDDGFANGTSVVNVFMATDPRIYGYGSSPTFAAGGQRVPAVAVEARPGCKNLVCSVQRLIGSCPAVRCQEGLVAADIARIAADALSFADGRRDAS
jgi:hypothetical protein